MTGARVLAAVLDRGRTVIPWHDEPTIDRQEAGTPVPGSATEVHVGGTIHRVPSAAAVRYREDAAVIFHAGRVRVLVESGELVLDAAEELALRSAWSTL